MTEDRITLNRSQKRQVKRIFLMKECLICDVNNFAGLDNMP